ncbi:MAG: FAD-dependent oxidoreductase [Patescibacteria group bacterium]|nr:FAD-dependent oxidoreductase [Patescibacteria group bacterium]MCL5431630.1 FAD-dependent oxidoreductase [Patescibacteria group bacterium]
MTTYTVKLKSKQEVAVGTMAFWWQRPEGYTFAAGQHADWTLINPPKTDAEGNGRTFTFAGAPQEPDLMICTRLRDTAFKDVLKDLAIGSQVSMGPARGSLVLHADAAKPAVLFAGGIGITPFRSLVLDAAARKLAHKITLFYSNRTPADAPFLQELSNVANPNYKFVPVFTTTQGHLDREKLAANIIDLSAPIYYIAGPTTMVLALRDLLISAGVPDTSIRTEDFEGY